VAGQAVTSEMAGALGLDRPRGLLIGDVYPGSAAARAGLRQGDALLSVDGQAVDDETSLSYRIGTHKAGDPVTVEYQRGGRVQTAKVAVEPPVALPARDQQLMQGRHPFDGAVVINLSPATAIELGVNPFAKGVMISEIRGGLSVNAGLRPGDLIRQVNGQAVDTVAQLRAMMTAPARTWRVTIVRDGQPIEATFNL
jgi:S1-C subfamily serine protease